jgi:P27 family predicted phage terminase small subunit
VRPDLNPPRGDFPQPPKHLGPLAREEWERVGRPLHAQGLLTVLDVAAFAAYCHTYEIWVMADQQARGPDGKPQMTITTAKGNVILSPIYCVARKAAADLVRYGACFGLGPRARAGVSATTPDAGDEFSGLLS